jgi:hypothetical protein
VHFLSAKANPAKSVLGWETIDDYRSCPVKYLALFRSNAIDPSTFDWIFFCDDDTYVFHNRLVAHLATLSITKESNDRLYVGHMLNDHNLFMSGGAGFALSPQLYQDLTEYARRTDTAPPLEIYSDKSMGYWMRDIMASGKNVKFLDFPEQFRGSPHTNEKELEAAITFHYVDEKLFDIYFAYQQRYGSA